MKRLVRTVEFLLVFSLLNAAFSIAWASGKAAYRRIAGELSQIARNAGISRVAVLSFRTPPGVAKSAGTAVSERLVSSVVEKGALQVVERAMLDEVLQEQKLQHSGAVASSQAKKIRKVMGVDAIVTGSVVSIDGGKFEVNARLVRSETAEIVGASMAQVREEWTANVPWENIFAWREAIVVPPPDLDVNLPAWWEKDANAASHDCGDWKTRVDDLQAKSMAVKVAYWSRRLGEADLHGKLTRNPGSEIRNPGLRREFYSRLKRNVREAAALPSKSAIARARAAEKHAQRLINSCD